MATEEFGRAGLKTQEGGVLFIYLGSFYVENLKKWISFNPCVAHFIFASVFEDSKDCGSSGVHHFIIDLRIGVEAIQANHYNSLASPVLAVLSITLEDYDALRRAEIRRPGRKFIHTFPEYTKVAGGG